MPHGPIPPGKQGMEQKETDQKEKDSKQTQAKSEGSRFTKEDEDLLEKLADRIRGHPDQTDTYEMLNSIVSPFHLLLHQISPPANS